MERNIETILNHYGERDSQLTVSRELGWVHVNYHGTFDKNRDEEVNSGATFLLIEYQAAIDQLKRDGSCEVQFGESALRLKKEGDEMVVDLKGVPSSIVGYHFSITPEQLAYRGQ